MIITEKNKRIYIPVCVPVSPSAQINVTFTRGDTTATRAARRENDYYVSCNVGALGFGEWVCSVNGEECIVRVKQTAQTNSVQYSGSGQTVEYTKQ